MNDKRYYWLKLEENYFDLKVQKALRKLPSGSDMLICYLKMQLKYLNTGGLIEYQGICDDLSKEIALDIDEEEDLVRMTLSVLDKWKVIEPYDSGLYIAEMQERIGSKTDVAMRVAKHREKQKMLHCNNDVTKCNSIQEIDIEKEKDIEIDNKEDNIEETCKYLESNFGRTISPLEYEKVKDWLLSFDIEMVKKAIELSVFNNKKNFSYINGILKNWKTNNIKTLDETMIEKKQDTLPQWFDKDIEEEKLSKEEEQELKNILENF